VKYAFMLAHREEFRVVAMARVLGVSRSGFYEWCQRRTRLSSRQARQAVLDHCVAAAFWAGKRRHGAPRLVDDLRDAGMPAGNPP
jgi:transposase